MVTLFLQHMHTLKDSNVLRLHQSYPFGDEISAQHQVILGNSSVAWENWKKSAPRKGCTKTVIQQHYTLIFSQSVSDSNTQKHNEQIKDSHVDILNRAIPELKKKKIF